MAKRSYCLYNGQYIGMESIFAVRNGKQMLCPRQMKIKNRFK